MYTSYYGFSAKPFQLSPDPRFFFGSSGHKRALAYLRYGLSQAEGFIVITGAIGTGKTTLARSLFDELNDSSVIAAQLVTTQVEADDLLRLVVAAFGLPHEDLKKASLIKRFEDFLRACARDGKRMLLVVDEAQNLPPRSLEELRMLSNFQISNTPLLQSFLLGQDEFRLTLQKPEMEQLRQRVIASCHLNPLSEQETREYIEHRLGVVGWQRNPHFTDEAYSAIHLHTAGIPRRINIFCDRLLLFGFLEELREFSAEVTAAVSDEMHEEMGTGTGAPEVPDSTTLETVKEPSHTSLAREPQFEQIERRLADLEHSVERLRRGLLEIAGRSAHQ